MYTQTVPLLVNLLVLVKSRPQTFIITTTSESPVKEIVPIEVDILDSGPKISKFHVTSNIQFRYAQTQVVSYVKNPSSIAEEISFTVVIPDSAFVSNFSMVLQGKEYVAQVKAKEDAKKEYDEAVTRGRGAGLVSQDARDANTFTVATNVEARQKVEFKLTYGELLERKLGKYVHVINVNPGQVVEDFRIEVFVNESLPIKSLYVPELKESNDLDFEENQESKIAQVERDVDGDTSKAHITFAPDKVYQEEAGEQGLSGQFLIQYEVDRNSQDNEIQVIDGYFVHYFTPEDLPILPKHVIFVLDTSGSMLGEKMNQLKDAMFTILDDMTDRDFFNIITFSSGVSHWKLQLEERTPTTIASDSKTNLFRTTVASGSNFAGTTVAPPNFDVQGKQFVVEATDRNRKDAIKHILDINAGGGTNINDGLLEGLKIAKFAKQNEKLPEDMQSILVFLSDGQASSGVTNGNKIKNNVKKANVLNVPIYSLGFGRDADFDLIKDISVNADAFSKQIYEGSDAAIQLENFFSVISSPLLSNLVFQYVGGLVDNSSVSEPEVRTFFKGGEFVVAGKLGDFSQNADDVIDITVIGDGRHGEQYLKRLQLCLRPGSLHFTSNDTESTHVLDSKQPDDVRTSSPTHPISCIYPATPLRSQAQNFLQKLHAFLNIKQLLKKTDQAADESNDSDMVTSKEKALQLALDNNFVTELTSLVVIRPDEEPKISNLKESKPDNGYAYGTGFSAFNRVAYNAPSALSYSPPASGYALSAYGVPAPPPPRSPPRIAGGRPKLRRKQTYKSAPPQRFTNYRPLSTTTTATYRPLSTTTTATTPKPQLSYSAPAAGFATSAYGVPVPPPRSPPRIAAGRPKLRRKQTYKSASPQLFKNYRPLSTTTTATTPKPQLSYSAPASGYAASAYGVPAPPRIVGGRPNLDREKTYKQAPPQPFTNYRPLYTTTTATYRPLSTTTTAITPKPIFFQSEEETIDLQKFGSTTCSGNITLFSKTYLRGESVTFSEDTENLETFDNSLVSIEVKGDCCWTVFTEVGYEGISQSFGQGKYTSVVQVGDVFRDGSSLRKSNVC